jgi:carboxymethylenebutenolidase
MAAYDLAALWEAHCRYEFETRDVDATMSTMVAEPYVNHIPTMTGGVGFESLRHSYAHSPVTQEIRSRSRVGQGVIRPVPTT